MAAAPSGFTKAYLDVENGEAIECLFNPKEYSISRQNQWQSQPVVGKDLPPETQFGGGTPQKLSLDLVFDDSETEDGDVRKMTDKLFDAMQVKDAQGGAKNTGRPPTVHFRWGETSTFKAVIEQLTVQYTLFHPNGTPVRAMAKLSLMQVEKAVPGKKKQNPTTRGLAGLRSHVVRDGDSLQSIAYAAYGDPTLWREIAADNGIDDPFRVRRGDVLSIPRLPT
jgi:nucleoid-associated protein YgaU